MACHEGTSERCDVKALCPSLFIIHFGTIDRTYAFIGIPIAWRSFQYYASMKVFALALSYIHRLPIREIYSLSLTDDFNRLPRLSRYFNERFIGYVR